MNRLVRPAGASDSEAIARICNRCIRTSIITFEEEEVPAGIIASRIEEVVAASLPWLVAEENGSVLGYAHAGNWRSRPAA